MISLEMKSDAAIIVLHEIYGINSHIYDTRCRYRDLEYSVYAPNFSGKK